MLDQARGVLGGYAAALALPAQRQAQRPAAFGDVGGVVTVIFAAVDRKGNARTATQPVDHLAGSRLVPLNSLLNASVQLLAGGPSGVGVAACVWVGVGVVFGFGFGFGFGVGIGFVGGAS